MNEDTSFPLNDYPTDWVGPPESQSKEDIQHLAREGLNDEFLKLTDRYLASRYSPRLNPEA